MSDNRKLSNEEVSALIEGLVARVADGSAVIERLAKQSEQIEVVLRTEAELEAMVRNGTMVDGKTIGAFTLWKLGAGEGRA
jgi:hypothetical protein